MVVSEQTRESEETVFWSLLLSTSACPLNCVVSVSHNAQLGVYYAQISTLDAHISSQCVPRTQRVFSRISSLDVSIDQLDFVSR